MLRWGLERLIDWSIEREAPLPGWLRRLTDRNERLVKYERASRQLCRRLREDVAAWIDCQAGSATESGSMLRAPVAWRRKPEARQRFAWSSAGYALAAGAAIAAAAMAMIGWSWTSSNSARDAELQGIRAVEKVVAIDSQWLNSVWSTHRADVERLNSRLTNLPEGVATLKRRGVATVVLPAEAARASAGQAKLAFNASVDSERQRLTEDLKSAAWFFTYQLPSSAAKLAGWL